MLHQSPSKQIPIFIIEDYLLVKSFKDLRFNKCTLLKHKYTNNPIFMLDRIYESQHSAHADISKLDARREIQSIYYSSPLDYDYIEIAELCSTFYQLSIYYNFHNNDLKKELRTRQKSQTNFSDEDIIKLLYESIAG